MTISELKAILETCPEDAEILIQYDTYAYLLVDTVNFDGEHFIITGEDVL